ncbi:uncharacterized protein LOC111088358 [Limulus polyphemus]|uniref:Uncharacterized protein LOC111088358 n=1 Tax=Limulus polyphemus TaxID=6850 RepID=A0ABM1TDK6_LIMPO|nr:uncharacterized protein LOC111088358 [Limulus polyphemus]
MSSESDHRSQTTEQFIKEAPEMLEKKRHGEDVDEERSNCKEKVTDETESDREPINANGNTRNEEQRIPTIESNIDKGIVNQAHIANNYNPVKISDEHFKAMVDYYGGKPFIKYEISVREKHGVFRKAVPLMPVSLSLLLCILNVLTPGIGTLLAGCTIVCGCRTEYSSRVKAIFLNILAAILQLILAPIVIGWVWSIMWGITFVNISVTKELQEPIVAAPV